MKRLIFAPLLIASLAIAENETPNVDGEAVFERVCASCHNKILTKAEAKKHFKNLKAPPMIEVSAQLKKNIKIVEDFDDEIHRAVTVAFIKDYVMNPHLDKSMCTAMALEKFDLMPSQRGKITEEELQAVSEWVYDYYKGKEFK
jgi:hypothetical protein